MNIPIVLIIYRRPDLVKQLVNSLRKFRPQNIYVVADGPKSGEENSLCEESRSAIDLITWPCNIHKVYAKTNMGLRNRVVSGLNYVFKREKWAIILEDDLVLGSSFLKYADSLLKKYEKDERIIAINGNNFLFNETLVKDSYYFTKYVHSWGWATWKRAWKLFDDNMTNWPEIRETDLLKKSLKSRISALYWKMIFDMVYAGNVDSWAYRWTYSALINQKLCVNPRYNLVSNVGYGKDASHTKYKSRLLNMPIRELTFPLKHPKQVVISEKLDKIIERYCYLTPIVALSLLIKSILRIKI